MTVGKQDGLTLMKAAPKGCLKPLDPKKKEQGAWGLPRNAPSAGKVEDVGKSGGQRCGPDKKKIQYCEMLDQVDVSKEEVSQRYEGTSQILSDRLRS